MVALVKHKPSFRAEHRVARIAPRKMRHVVDVVRGKDYNTALHALRAMPEKGAMLGIKLLKSAFANASQRIREQRLDIDPEQLCVVEARVDGGPTFWGMRPSSMRRPQFIHRRTSHIVFVLQERETAPERKAEPKPEARPEPAPEPTVEPATDAKSEEPKKQEKKTQRGKAKKSPPKTKRKTKRREK